MDNTDRLLNKIISVLLFTVLLIMLTIGSIFFVPPSFASSIVDFNEMQISTDNDARSVIGTYTYGSNTYDVGVYTSYTVPVYFFLYDTGNDYPGIMFVREHISGYSGSIYCRKGSSSSVSNADYFAGAVSSTMTATDGTSVYFYRTTYFGDSFNNSNDYYIYPSFQDGVDDFVEYLNNGFSSPLVASPATIIVRPGNVAYIGYDDGYCNLSVRLSKAVKTFSSNTRIGFSSSRPAEGSTLYYDNSTGNSVSWVNSQPRDILGRSTYFTYHETFNSVGYFIIYNPAYDDAGNANNAISAEFSAYTSVVQFPLTTSLVDGSTVSTGDADEFYMSQGEEMMSSPGIPTYIYTGTDGTTSSALEVPASQYNYYAPEENEEGLLSGFVQRIVQLLSAPVKHIQNLFNEGLTFMTWLSGLWSWLPVEVVGILTSALIVLIVVGVIKVFWK